MSIYTNRAGRLLRGSLAGGERQPLPPSPSPKRRGGVRQSALFLLPLSASGRGTGGGVSPESEPFPTFLCPSASNMFQWRESPVPVLSRIMPGGDNMAILQRLSTLALRQVVDGACKVFGFAAGA